MSFFGPGLSTGADLSIYESDCSYGKISTFLATIKWTSAKRQFWYDKSCWGKGLNMPLPSIGDGKEKSDQDIKERGSKCPMCDKTFSNQGNMKTHVVLMHSEYESKMLNCSICN